MAAAAPFADRTPELREALRANAENPAVGTLDHLDSANDPLLLDDRVRAAA